MKFKKEYFCCSSRLLEHIPEIKEIETCLDRVKWAKTFCFQSDGKPYLNQTGYNKALDKEFSTLGWTSQPALYHNPKLIGDFGKNDIVVEVQFGNISAIYRDYYKFHYGLVNNLWSLAFYCTYKSPNFLP